MEPLGVSDVALLVGMVNTGGRSGKWWAMKARTILALAPYLDGEWFNAPDVERLTGISAPLARRLLLELERQKVILRDGGHDANPKVFWCEVNPDWRAWQVEWALPARDIEMRLEYARATWARHPLDRLFSRPAGARSHRVIALVSARDYARERAQTRPVIARQQGAITDQGSRALRARSRSRRAQEVSLLGLHAADEVSSLAKRQEEEGKKHPGWVQVREAYRRRAGVPWLNGAPASALARLVAAYGDAPVLEAIDRAPDGLGVSFLVDDLIRVLALTPEQVAQEAEVVTPLVDAEGRARARKNLEQLVATIRADGGEPDEELLAELARWQDGEEALEEA